MQNNTNINTEHAGTTTGHVTLPQNEWRMQQHLEF
jgi:hypothetical protein